MNKTSYYGLGVLLAGVALIGFGGAGDRPPASEPALVVATEPESLRSDFVESGHLAQQQEAAADSLAPAQRFEAPVDAPVATRSQQPSAGRAPQRNPRRFRGRNRNRYPGPIPTPAEWRAPEGPVRIALQAGHWRANEAPDELSGLKDNGTRGGGKAEWEVNLAIARTAAAMLEEKGYVVDVLPAVVPPDYRAHLFIAIHADGSADTRATGYRVAAPRQDATGRASQVVTLLEESYARATGLRRLPDVTRRMENYYAFNFRRYQHALHPMTIAVILETGFLTSPSDRRIIVDDPGRVARGIVEAVAAFPITALPQSGGSGRQ